MLLKTMSVLHSSLFEQFKYPDAAQQFSNRLPCDADTVKFCNMVSMQDRLGCLRYGVIKRCEPEWKRRQVAWKVRPHVERMVPMASMEATADVVRHGAVLACRVWLEEHGFYIA